MSSMVFLFLVFVGRFSLSWAASVAVRNFQACDADAMERLFVAQSHIGIEAAGAEGRDVAGGAGNKRERGGGQGQR